MNAYTLAIWAVLLLFLWLFMIRPASKRNREMRQDQQSAKVGSEVMLTSGIFGTVSGIDEDAAKIVVEIAPGVHVHVARAAIATVTAPKTDESVEPAGDTVDETDEATETH